MTNDAPNTPPQEAKERPSFRAWIVQDKDGEDPTWTELAGLWPTRKGNGFTGTLRQPVALAGGRLVILPAQFTPNKEVQS